MSITKSKELIKGGEFLIKETKCEDVFVPSDLSEEQVMIKSMIKEFIEKEVWPVKARFEKKDYALTKEIMDKIAELGLLGAAVPEEYGGMGMDFVTSVMVCDYISGVSGSLSTAFGAHTGIGTMPILLYGTEDQKKKYIPNLVSGKTYGAYCLTEPSAGSDANSGKTKAVLSGDGKTYSISGQKMWISNAGFCGLMIVFARIEDDKNITAFIVEYDKNNPNGIVLGEEEGKLGIRSSSTRQVFYNDTIVPVENMLSTRGNGFKIALNSLNVGRIKLAAACIDASKKIINLSVGYANERKQFKTPISSFGAIQYKIAEMATKTYVMEAGTYRSAKDIESKRAELLAGGASHQEAELKAVEEYAIECAMLKVYASEVVQYNSDEGIQIFGGMGFSDESAIESTWRDARISRIYEGTNEINRLLSVGMLIKRALAGSIDLMGPAMAVGEEILGIPSFDIPDYSETLSMEMDIVKSCKKILLMVAGKAIEKYGMELENHQQVILAAAEIMMEIYMAESTILKVQRLAKQDGEAKHEVEVAIAKLNLYNAVEKINKHAKEGIFAISESDEQKGLLMGLKRFTKYAEFPNPIELRKTIAKSVIDSNSYNW
ncbi:MAG: acyl-CoA dehydrogenase family protein [Flavobacteriaceae bacterium]|nr:acyl-CoA dehydrogenase family protein [Flavobacteriaceae bacterium]